MHTERQTDRTCLACGMACDSLNGRYCRALGAYVEYGRPKECPTLAREARKEVQP